MPEPSRQEVVADAGLHVLATEGMRGLTHRAVDEAANLPAGSCSNVFRSRAELIGGLADRIYQRLTPSEEYLTEQAEAAPTKEQWRRLMCDLVDRARAQPELHIAMLELRLEATRRSELVDPLSDVVRRSLEADLTFHDASGLAGGRDEIVLLHLAIGGLINELLTLPDALGIVDHHAVTSDLVDRIVFSDAT